MGPWEKRIVGALLLLTGLTLLGLSIYMGQLDMALRFVVRGLKSALAGLA